MGFRLFDGLSYSYNPRRIFLQYILMNLKIFKNILNLERA